MIFEMNAEPEPDWSNEFQKYLENELHINRTDCIFAVGELHRILRKNGYEVKKK